MEQRRCIRRRTLKSGKVICNANVIYDCMIRNVSEQGACIQLPNTIDIPNHFELLVEATRVTHACQVLWRTGTQLGISFVGDLRSAGTAK
jgi:PilZ domain